jgi:phosphohistidine phosphatase SixA
LTATSAPQASFAAVRIAQRTVASLAVAAALGSPVTAGADDRPWPQLVAGGHTVLLRHAATEPGVGDPPNFRLGDCATQRNLSEAGRADARRIGNVFAERGVRVGPVLAGEWCRTRDTARLAFGRYTVETALNSFFGDRGREAVQTARLKTLVAAAPRDAVQVMVTHQVNITALTGEVPAMGEAVVVRAAPDGGVTVVGRLAPAR